MASSPFHKIRWDVELGDGSAGSCVRMSVSVTGRSWHDMVTIYTLPVPFDAMCESAIDACLNTVVPKMAADIACAVKARLREEKKKG